MTHHVAWGPVFHRGRLTERRTTRGSRVSATRSACSHRGDLRISWCSSVATAAEYEQVLAWGRPMLVATRFGSPEDDGSGPARRLETMRSRLIERYPPIGPIFA